MVHSGLKTFCGFSMGNDQYLAGMVNVLCLSYDESILKAQPKVVLEKPGIEHVTPGLQGIALIHFTTVASVWVDFVQRSVICILSMEVSADNRLSLAKSLVTTGCHQQKVC